MSQKKYYFVALFATLMIFGCNDELVTTPPRQTNRISGETKLVKFVDQGTTKMLVDGKKEIRNQVAIFEDISSSKDISGLRNLVLNHDYDSQEHGKCYGTFSMETENGYWEGSFTGHTTSSGTTIKAIGYNFDDRGESCEWRYYFPSSLEGKRGTYSANISTNIF